MEFKNAVLTRRSIRKFSEKAVEKDVLKDVIAMTAYAPSWKNSQTASYIAIYDTELKTKIAEECVLGFEHNSGIIKSAPVLIVETTKKERAGYERDGSFTTSKGTHWESFDAGISAQTFCLCAHEMGLGTVIMGIYDEEAVIKALGLDEGLRVSALIALGYEIDEHPSAPPRRSVDELLTIR